MAKKTLLDNIIESIKDVDGRLIKQSSTTEQMISDLNYKVVAPAKSAADSAVSAADAAVASAQVTSATVSAVASATAEAKQGANEAMSRALSAWDVATGAKEAVTDFDPLIKSAQSDAGMALTQIADTAIALSDAKTAFDSDVAAAKNLASTAQTTADNAVKSASSVADDLTAVASQAKSNADGITKVTSDVGLLQTTVADNSGNISMIQETAKQIQQAMSDSAGNITVAKQTADSAVAVASDASSNATVAIQTASQASITAQNASGQAASAVLTANGAMTTASNAKSDATVAVQTASGASLTATNAQSDATIAKQTASEATVQASNAESNFAQLSIRANKIEANVATNSGAIASVQQTANGLTTSVSSISDQLKASGHKVKVQSSTFNTSGNYSDAGVWLDGTRVGSTGDGISFTMGTLNLDWSGYTQKDYATTSSLVSDLLALQDKIVIIYMADAIPPYGSDLVNALAKMGGDSKLATATSVSFIRSPFIFIGMSLDTNGNQVLQEGEGYLNAGIGGDGQVKYAWGYEGDSNKILTSSTIGKVTEIKTTVDGITTIINDPKTGLNATYQTAAGNATTISNVKSDVYQLETTATGLTSRVGNLESKTNTQQTAIEQNKNAIALKADQTDVDTLKGNVTGLQAEITTQANEIQAKVTKSDVTGMLTGYATQEYTQSLVTQTANNWNLNLTKLQTDVNAIKTTGGGVNLLLGTSGTLQTVPNASGWNTNLPSYIPTVKTVDSDTTYTARVWISPASHDMALQIVWRDSSGSTHYDNGNAISAGTSGYSTWSGTITSGSTIQSGTIVFTVQQSTNSSVSYKEFQLEEGTVAHTWSPAPSDMATVTSVANLSATVDGIQAQVYNSDGSSRITQLSNLISTKVSSDDFNSLSQSVNLQTLDSADINNMKTNGHYFVHNLANNPIGGWVYIDVTGNGNDRIRQDVYQDNGTKHKYRRWVDTNWTDWEEGATYTEINQLQDAINLRVTKGDLISQINLQAGTSLIQSNKLVLDATTTVFTGDAFIPSASIAELDADKLTFYGNGAKASIGASVAQYDDDKTKSTINLQYDGGIEIHSSNQQGSILTMHDNTIRLASKTWGDNSNPYQYSGFYAAPNYSLMNTYHRDGTTSGVAIDDNQIKIYGSSKDPQLGALQADVGWYSINGKTGLLTGDQITLKAGNTQAVLTDNNININNASDTNSNNYDVAINIKGWAKMTGWFTCMGITQTSLLSTKTRIEPLDTKVALDKIVSANVNTYQFKTDVANGKTKRHASVIIDDVNDVAEYYTPEEFISENRMGRDDGDIIGYLMGAVQELKKQLDGLKEKI